MAGVNGKFLIVLGACLAVSVLQCVAATSYDVGGSSAWTIPTSNKLYSDWVKSTTFKLGDKLVFKFTTGQQNAYRVSKADYEKCSVSNPMQKYETGPATVTLNSTGHHYYICAISGHCTAGQKVSVKVSALQAASRSTDLTDPLTPFTPRDNNLTFPFTSTAPPGSTNLTRPLTAPPGSTNLTNLTRPLTAPPGSTNLTRPLTPPSRKKPSNLTIPPRSTNLTRPLTPLSGNWTRPSGKKTSKIVPILVGSVVGTALFVMLCLVFGRCVRHRKSSVITDKNLDASGSFGQVSFDYKVLRDSTENFDRKNMLGKGGFGEVYKGRLPDGRVVAVKKLNGRQTTEAAEEFLTEVRLISSVRHRNLVRLLGCCKRGNKRLLVYEFMSNNSLDKHLFGEIRNALSWENRLNIIVGTARGLAYLHGESNVRIIHRDIKCANILLDDRLHPKIADFGLARFFPESQTHVSTRVGGTIGYTAPEYAVHGQLTEKADVYSYGIVVLEIVSGRKCVDARLPVPLQLLLEWAWNQFEQNQVLDVVDPLLEGKYPREQALRVITIALLCTQGSWTQRPAMSKVVSMLTNSSDSTGQPTRPAFIDVAEDRPPNFIPTPESATSAAGAPTQGSHGSISVSLLPR